MLPSGFTYLNDPRMIISIDYASSQNFMSRPLAGYEKNVCILTHPAANALFEVQNLLDKHHPGLCLKIFDAYRPQSAVDDILTWVTDPFDQKMKALYYPDHEKEELLVLGYLAEKQSTHSRGSTVDLTLCNNHGNTFTELDMGSRFDYFSEKSHTAFSDISLEAIQNRKLLLYVMEQFGFINYPKEWWHFTLADEPYPDTYFDFPVR